MRRYFLPVCEKCLEPFEAGEQCYLLNPSRSIIGKILDTDETVETVINGKFYHRDCLRRVEVIRHDANYNIFLLKVGIFPSIAPPRPRREMNDMPLTNADISEATSMDECFCHARPLELTEIRGCLHLEDSGHCMYHLSDFANIPCPIYGPRVEPRADSDDDGEVE